MKLVAEHGSNTDETLIQSPLACSTHPQEETPFTDMYHSEIKVRFSSYPRFLSMHCHL